MAGAARAKEEPPSELNPRRGCAVPPKGAANDADAAKNLDVDEDARANRQKATFFIAPRP